MIHHCVFLNFTDACADSARQEMVLSLRELVDDVPGMVSLTGGPNEDYESKSPNHNYGFVAVFEDRESLAAYDSHARHREVGAQLVENCVGGHAGIMVFDIVSA